MKAIVQRVLSAEVSISADSFINRIENGLLIYLGIHSSDTKEVVEWMVKKCLNLRVFPNEEGKIDRSVLEQNGEILVVSQFTLYADCSKGNRPGFSNAAPPKIAEPLYEYFVERMINSGGKIKTGKFQADMVVSSQNWGPLTLILEK